MYLYETVYMNTLVTALLRSNTNIVCQIGWLSASLVVSMFLGIDGCQEHHTGTMKQEGTVKLMQHPTKTQTLPCKMYYTWSGSQTARQQTQPARPANPTQPAQPIHTAPGQQATQKSRNVTNCMVFLEGSESQQIATFLKSG